MTAIHYHPEAYSTAGPKLMGRHAAGESFLRAYLAHNREQALWVYVEEATHARHFEYVARSHGCTGPVHTVERRNLGALREAQVLDCPGPGIAPLAWQRAAFGDTVWSLCGITHTLSSANAMDAIAELLTAPVQPWDALICTSHAGRSQVQGLLQAQADYLRSRLGISKLLLPQLPVIPLGIHTADFAFTPAQRAAARAWLAQRAALSVDETTVVVLFAGRLSFHAKAHPLAMYQALEAAVSQTGRSVLLVECGQHANGEIARAYTEAAALACPAVRVVHLDGREAVAWRNAWASADLFCSLSDNIQETFGITPLEAMATGLPVVVSDWDGYKDTVREGVDGFRVPTLMPDPGFGQDLALRHALEVDSYDRYCGHACSLVAVDVAAATRAFVRLMSDDALRWQMGAAGRERARQVYDWAVILPQYETLWAELGARRQAAAACTPRTRQHPWPARMDPFAGFAGYPSQQLGENTLLAAAIPDPLALRERFRALRSLAMVKYADPVLPTDDEVQHVFAHLSSGPRLAVDLVADFALQRRPLVLRGLAWLLKLGVLMVADAPALPLPPDSQRHD